MLYHRVDGSDNHRFLKVPVISPEGLEKELSFLIKNGAVFFTAEQLLNGSFPKPNEAGFIITFDDCFLDNYTIGLNVLEKLGIKGVFFQSTDMVDGKALLWEHALYWFAREDAIAGKFTALAHNLLTGYPQALKLSGARLADHLINSEEVPIAAIEALIDSTIHALGCSEEMARIAGEIYPRQEHLRKAHESGHEIGSHGRRHYVRKIIDKSLFEEELRLSGDIIGRIIGRRPTAFSYPFNSYFAEDKELCAKYFSQVFTVDSGHISAETDRLSLPRYTWPGPVSNEFRRRRWLLSGTI